MVERNIKIFDLARQEILSRYLEQDDLNDKVCCFNEYFNIPPIMLLDLENKISIEKFIDPKPKSEWSTEDYEIVVDRIFSNYVNYYDHYSNQNKLICIRVTERLKKIKRINHFPQ